MTSIKSQLLDAEGKKFVELTFRADDGHEETIPMCWIEKVRRKTFSFQPSIIHHWTGKIEKVVKVKELS